MTITMENYLDDYAELNERLQFLQTSVAELKDKAIPQEVKDKLAEIEAEYKPMLEDTSVKMETIKVNIETFVLTMKETVKGTKYMAVYVSGKKSWDGKKLEGYAMDHPEILQAQKIGEPSVTFRKVK